MIQSFLNKTISKEVKEDDIIYFYGKDEELLAESNLIENRISEIIFYDPKFHPFMTDEEKQQLIQLVQKTFQKEHLVLDVIIDYDSYYTAYFTLNEPKYNIAIHSTGIGSECSCPEVS